MLPAGRALWPRLFRRGTRKKVRSTPLNVRWDLTGLFLPASCKNKLVKWRWPNAPPFFRRGKKVRWGLQLFCPAFPGSPPWPGKCAAMRDGQNGPGVPGPTRVGEKKLMPLTGMLQSKCYDTSQPGV